MNKYKIFPLIVILIMAASVVLAAMPEDHTNYNLISMESYPDTSVGRIVNKYPQDFIACDLMADISVFYYFSEGFTSIGKEYRATHSKVLCTKMVELAGNDEKALACAYGVCAHHVQDSVYHNTGVPRIIEMTGVPNGLIHAFWEEKMDKSMESSSTRPLKSTVNNALSYVKQSSHREEFRRALIATGSTLPFDTMWDKFVDTVVGSSKYSPGFQGFTAVPYSIHIMLILVLVASFILLSYLIKSNVNNIYAKIMKVVNVLTIVLIIGLYLLFFTNNLWQAFEFVSTPVTWFIPAGNEVGVRIAAQQETNKLFIYGANYVAGITDPSGADNLMAADAASSGLRNVIMVLAVVVIVLFGYLTFKRGKKR
jgi:hypothetical protein